MVRVEDLQDGFLYLLALGGRGSRPIQISERENRIVGIVGHGMLLISRIFGDFTGDVVHHMLGLDHVTPRQALPIQGFQERMGENTAFQII